MRFFAVAALNPSPVRYFEYVSAGGSRDLFQQDCAGPGFSDHEVVWRFCEYPPSEVAAEAAPWGMVRFDLNAGEAALDWPLPEPADAQLLALAKSPAGDLATAWGRPDLSAVYLILEEGSVVPVDPAPGPPAEVIGLAWDGDALELVLTAGTDAAIWRSEANEWTEARRVDMPQACGPAMRCALQAARHDPDGWRFVWAAAPVEIPDSAVVDLMLRGESGAATPMDSIPLADLAPDQYSLEGDELVRLGALFDRAPGGAVNWSLDGAPLVWVGEGWQRIDPPASDSSFYFSNYQIEPGGLRWIPGLRYPLHGWQVGNWIALAAASGGVKLANLTGGDSGPALTPNTVFLRGGASQAAIFPAADGGYWVLGPNGAYLKASDDLRRADRMTLGERIGRAFENFVQYRAVNDDFYRERRALKMAAFPLVLLSLPTGYLLVFFVRQARKDTRAWVILLLQVSAVYVVVATVFFWWFWEIMNDF